MAYTELNFSRSALVALNSALPGKREYYKDSKEAGLLLCVTATGNKSFQVYLKVSGRPERVTLGRFNPSLADGVELPRDCSHTEFLANSPELNVRMARELAARVKLDLKAGIRPADVKRAKRSEMTLGELFEAYVEKHLIPKKKKRIADTRENFQRYLGKLPDEPRKKHGKQREKTKGSVNWQNRSISSITRQEVLDLISNIGTQGSRSAANRALILLRAMYNCAKLWGYTSKDNPASGISKFKERKRSRFLQHDELPRFFESVAAEPSKDIRDYVLMSLLSGARKGNVLGMRWEDINLDRATWVIPEEVSKNGDPMTVPLMEEAVTLLRNRKPKEAATFVFPGRGKTGHLQGAKRGWKRVLDRDELKQLAKRINDAGHSFEYPAFREKPIGIRGKTKGPRFETESQSLDRARAIAADFKIDTVGTRLTDLRIHDMRRTLGSWQAATGASLVIIGESLGHKDLSSTTIYAHLNIHPVRNSMENATKAMLEAGQVAKSAEIIPIKKTA